jgi:transglutaminase-like putative cysteine protease
MNGTPLTMMQRMSLYISLMLSIGCLAYADLAQSEHGVPFFYAGMFIALGFAYWAEDRFVLSNKAANLLAGLVVVGGGLWLTWQLKQESAALGSGIFLTRDLVSHAGPVLGCLLLAKLFRPKVASDLWLLHLLGLVQVLLASVLAMGTRLDRDAPLFPIMLFAYLTSLVWAHRWFYLARETNGKTNVQSLVPPLSQEPSPAVNSARKAKLYLPRWLSFKPFGWFLASFLVAMVLFFSLPQGGLEGNIFQDSEQTETGASQKIDLNAEGTVDVSDEQVMRIWVTNSQGKVMIPDSLRLRGAVLSIYGERSGEWKAPEHWSANFTTYKIPRPTGPLADDRLRFEFDIDVNQVRELGRVRGAPGSKDTTVPLFLPDPPSADQSDHAYSMPNQRVGGVPLFILPFEGVGWLTLTSRVPSLNLTYDYLGSINAGQWSQRIVETNSLVSDQLKILLKVPQRIRQSGRIAALAQEALRKAKLPATATAEEKALALEQFLSSNGFVYSLTRPRQDSTVDPIEDFVCNVKEGHCERFASALAIMLRSIGIPARLVMGYRGAEWNELGGFYVIRQLHAHAWVEALIKQEHDPRGIVTLRWMVLDPSPASDRGSGESVTLSPLSFARFLWEFFILDFAGQSHRSRLLAQLQGSWLGAFFRWWSTLTWWQAALVAVGFFAAITGVIYLTIHLWRRRRRRRTQAAVLAVIKVPFFARLLRLLSRMGWHPVPGQTAAEFAQTVQPQLLKHNGAAAVANVPKLVVPEYYAVRFGEKTLTADELAAVDEHLDSLQAALG